MIKRIPFVEWLPDVDEANHPGIFYLKNGVPGPKGYENPVNDGQELLSQASTAGPLNGFSAVRSDGKKYIFVGTEEKIWRVSATSTTTDVSGATYTATTQAAGGFWDFTQYDDDVIATNYSDAIQRLSDMGTASTFVDLSAATATPKARTITASRNFLVAGNINDNTDGVKPQRVHWSALGDPTDWVVSSATQSDFEDIKGPGGPVMQLFGGEYVIVLQNNAIQRMNYVGPPTVWQFDEVSRGRGLLTMGAAAQDGELIFFLAENGFQVLANGSEVRPIGENKVDGFFFSDVIESRMSEIRCCIDPIKRRVMWSYPSQVPFDTDIDINILVYDYTLDRWGIFGAVGETGQEGQGVGAIFKGRNDHYGDHLAIAYNNRTSSNAISINMLNGNAQSFHADTVIESGKLELSPGRNSMTKNVMPMLSRRDSAGVTKLSASVEVFNSLNDRAGRKKSSTTYNDSTSEPRRLSIRGNGRFHKFGINIQNESNSPHLNDVVDGVDIEFNPTHWR